MFVEYDHNIILNIRLPDYCIISTFATSVKIDEATTQSVIAQTNGILSGSHGIVKAEQITANTESDSLAQVWSQGTLPVHIIVDPFYIVVALIVPTSLLYETSL